VPIQIAAYDSEECPLQNLLITKGMVISSTDSRSVRYFSCSTGITQLWEAQKSTDSEVCRLVGRIINKPKPYLVCHTKLCGCGSESFRVTVKAGMQECEMEYRTQVRRSNLV